MEQQLRLVHLVPSDGRRRSAGVASLTKAAEVSPGLARQTLIRSPVRHPAAQPRVGARSWPRRGRRRRAPQPWDRLHVAGLLSVPGAHRSPESPLLRHPVRRCPSTTGAGCVPPRRPDARRAGTQEGRCAADRRARARSPRRLFPARPAADLPRRADHGGGPARSALGAHPRAVRRRHHGDRDDPRDGRGGAHRPGRLDSRGASARCFFASLRAATGTIVAVRPTSGSAPTPSLPPPVARDDVAGNHDHGLTASRRRPALAARRVAVHSPRRGASAPPTRPSKTPSSGSSGTATP